jgi:hyperosmotically inducible protein
MTMRALALTCVLSAAACGGADNPPAQDPSSTTTMTPPSVTDTQAASPAVTDPSSATAAHTSTTSVDTTPAPATGVKTADHSTDTAPAPAPMPGAAAINNPGAADQTKDADNTKINSRDRHGALTPMDQGNSGTETKITAAIRKGIMRDKTLSFTAKNVKVITVGSKVTLRGPVKTDQEKSAIEAIATQAAGVAEVDDQLEVKK